MKKSFLIIAGIITIASAGTSFYTASLQNPTDLQNQLGNTANTIVIAGTGAIFGLLDNDK